MTPEDAAKVLTFISVYDNRQFDSTVAKVWSQALEGLELADCLEAVTLYYRQTRTWMMPSDLRQQVRSILVARRMAAADNIKIAAIEGANTDPAVVTERIDMLRQAAANACSMPTADSPHPKQDSGLQRRARAQQCPWCGAPERQACTNTATGQPSQISHHARLQAAGLVAA